MIENRMYKKMDIPKAQNKEEEKYIKKRKRKAMRESLSFYICHVFPIKKKLISVCTFEGKTGFGCNPKYIVEKLHERHPEYEFVWFLNKDVFTSKQFPEYIKKVPNTRWSRAYWLSKSKVWIDNYRKPYGTIKRKGQYYLNVNHYTIGIKCTGLWRESGFSLMAYLVSKNDSDMIDDLVIDSKWSEDVSPKGMVYQGTYLKTGAPRCDVLFGNRISFKEKFRKSHDIPMDAKVIMYAPTFREGANDGSRFVFSREWSIDFERLLNVLHMRFGGEWYLCVRVHPQLAPMMKEYQNPNIGHRIIDESQADDMYEILAGMDAYITDYSSAVFEAGFAEIPSFIYADDIKEYEKDRGNLMWNLATDPVNHIKNNKKITPQFDVEFPFDIATNNEELEKIIIDFDVKHYRDRLALLFNQVGLIFTGKASESICDRIEEVMEKK